MKPSEIYRENADNCALLAEGEPTRDTPAYKRYRRMEEAWRSLAEEQEWLDGEVPPVRIAVVGTQKTARSPAPSPSELPAKAAGDLKL
jgi:hypothetical protein